MRGETEIAGILDAWVLFCGVQATLAGKTRRALEEAERTLERVIAGPAQARAMVSRADDPDLLAALLVQKILREDSAPDARALLQWLALVAEFCRDAHCRPHANWLDGYRAVVDESPGPEAATRLEEALQQYEAMRASDGLRSTAAAALGLVKARVGDGGAGAHFRKAVMLAANAGESAWIETVGRLARRWEERGKMIEALLSDSAVSRSAAIGLGGFDRDLAVAIQARAIRAMLRADPVGTVAAARAVDRVSHEIGEEPVFLESAAEFALSQKQTAVAEALALAAIADRPDTSRGRLVLARVLWATGRFDEAEGELRSLLAGNLGLAAAHRDLGIIHVHRRQPVEALVAFATAVELDPTDVTARHLLERLSPSRLPGARFDPATGSMELDPTAFAMVGRDAVPALMTAAIIRGMPRKAVELLADAESKGPHFAQQVKSLLFPGMPADDGTHFGNAEKLFAQRKFREAIAEYRLAIAEQATASAYMGLGDCHYHLGEFDLAVAFFEESIAIKPRASTYRFLGDAHRQRGRIDDAIQAYRSAIDLDPTYEAARLQLEAIEGRRRS